jgi:FAD/FMN-containing dehydrogenase
MSLYRDLVASVDGEVHIDEGSRAAYSHDSSNYRQTPVAVVVPRTVEAGVAAVQVCHDRGVPIHSRGGGTSLAGQCCNEGVVIDWSKYCTRLLSVDGDRAVVEPGACLDDLNAELAGRRLMVGPKPATHENCTIGGMIGNNSCGASAQAYGKMADSVIRLEVLIYDGTRMWVGPTSKEAYELGARRRTTRWAGSRCGPGSPRSHRVRSTRSCTYRCSTGSSNAPVASTGAGSCPVSRGSA